MPIVNNGLTLTGLTHKLIKPWCVIEVKWDDAPNDKVLVVESYDADRPHNWKGQARYMVLDRGGNVYNITADQIVDLVAGVTAGAVLGS